MADQEIRILHYNPAWPVKFENEEKLLEKTLGSWITGGVHHIGSTSVPSLSAKPIIDILVGVDNLKNSRPCIYLLSKINYLYFPYKPEQEHWFCKPSPEHRTHHLHIMATSNPEFKARLAFRDYLRKHPDARIAYEELKLKLASEFKNNREAYTEAKGEFVKEIVAKALT